MNVSYRAVGREENSIRSPASRKSQSYGCHATYPKIASKHQEMRKPKHAAKSGLRIPQLHHLSNNRCRHQHPSSSPCKSPQDENNSLYLKDHLPFLLHRIPILLSLKSPCHQNNIPSLTCMMLTKPKRRCTPFLPTQPYLNV